MRMCPSGRRLKLSTIWRNWASLLIWRSIRVKFIFSAGLMYCAMRGGGVLISSTSVCRRINRSGEHKVRVAASADAPLAYFEDKLLTCVYLQSMGEGQLFAKVQLSVRSR